MDRAFSVDDIADQFWSSPPPMRLSQATELDLDSSSAAAAAAAASTTKMMNRSSSEWAFQQFLEEATASATADCTESSSSSPPQQKNVIEIKDQIFNNHNLNAKPKSNLTSFGSGIPSNIAIDSDEYQAFLKSRLDLACAAVAFTRANYVKTQDPAELAPVKVSQEANASESGSRVPPKESEQELTKVQHKEPGGLVGISSLPEVQKKPVVQVRSTTSGSSREQSDDDEAEGEAETTQNKDGTDVKRVRRMLSNRESARRSRRRKQAHLTDLETQVSQHRVENSSLLKRLTDISQKYNESAVDNRVLKADVETLRAKVKMAEETVKRVTGLNPFFQAMSEISTMVMPSFTGSPSDTSGDAAVPVQDEPKHHYYQATPNSHMSTHDPRIQNSMIDISTIENVQHNPATAATGSKIGRTSSMQRVASLEHLQKRIRGEASPRGT